MSGGNLEKDISSILMHCNMFNRESIGYIAGVRLWKNSKSRSLFESLSEFLTISRKAETGVLYDYIIITSDNLTTSGLLKALDIRTEGGVVVVELVGNSNKYLDNYRAIASGVGATKVNYGDRSYLVIHTGADYGN